MEKGLLEKTGKTLDYWIEVVKKSNIEKHKAIIDFLKSEHDFTYGYANFVSHKTRKSDAASFDAEDLVTDQYKGKETLKPIYEMLLKEITSFGTDITITPKKGSVSLIRKKQFALIKPATKIRIDLGLKLKGKEITERLENSGPFGSMCTHRVRITNEENIDYQLIEWLKEAYEKAI
jgi:predicted transport protein